MMRNEKWPTGWTFVPIRCLALAVVAPLAVDAHGVTVAVVQIGRVALVDD